MSSSHYSRLPIKKRILHCKNRIRNEEELSQAEDTVDEAQPSTSGKKDTVEETKSEGLEPAKLDNNQLLTQLLLLNQLSNPMGVLVLSLLTGIPLQPIPIAVPIAMPSMPILENEKVRPPASESLPSPISQETEKGVSETSSVTCRLERRNSKKRQTAQQTLEDRRIEANLRERHRVQAIGEQYEILRKQLPVTDPRLSKVSVLRIACKYIEYLDSLLGNDFTKDKSAPDYRICKEKFHETLEKEAVREPRRRKSETTSEETPEIKLIKEEENEE